MRINALVILLSTSAIGFAASAAAQSTCSQAYSQCASGIRKRATTYPYNQFQQTAAGLDQRIHNVCGGARSFCLQTGTWSTSAGEGSRTVTGLQKR